MSHKRVVPRNQRRAFGESCCTHTHASCAKANGCAMQTGHRFLPNGGQRRSRFGSSCVVGQAPRAVCARASQVLIKGQTHRFRCLCENQPLVRSIEPETQRIHTTNQPQLRFRDATRRKPKTTQAAKGLQRPRIIKIRNNHTSPPMKRWPVLAASKAHQDVRLTHSEPFTPSSLSLIHI